MATVNNGVDVTLKKKQIKGSIVFPTTVRGLDGKSAYEIAVEQGYEGTIEEWLESLQGDSGVYIGSEEPSDEDINVWIDPNGQPTTGIVTSVNNKTGEVTLDAEDVGALPDDTEIPTIEYLSSSDIIAIWNM